MSTNTIVAAAAPTLIQAIELLQAFEADIGPDAAKWPVTVPAAKLKLLGSLALLLPELEVSEVTAVGSLFTTTSNGWIAKLKALGSPQAPASA